MVQQRRDRPPKPFKAAKAIPTHARRPTRLGAGARRQGAAASATPTPVTTPAYPRPNLPRLYFNGRFYTDPSTTNNYVNNYDVAKFRPNYQLIRDEQNFNGSWNPDGSATFALIDCKVNGAYSPAGAGGEDPDVLVGEQVAYNRRSVYGKISDLDPQMQTISALYGVRFNVGEPGAQDGLSALMLPTSFCDMWGGIYNPNSGDSMGAYIQGYSAVYHGLLRLDEFAHNESNFLSECQPYIDASAAYAEGDDDPPYPNGALSVRFRVDWYCNDPEHEDFCYGNVSGYITPWLPGYPLSFDIGRQLYTTADSNGVSEATNSPTAMCSIAYAAVEAKPDFNKYSLFVDLVNSIYRLRPTGEVKNVANEDEWETPYQDQGKLEIGYFDAPWDPEEGGTATFMPIKEVPYLTKAFDDASCVMDITLQAGQYGLILQKQLGLRATKGNEVKYRLAEAKDGFYTRADTFVYHLQGEASTPETAKLYCSRWGVMLKNQDIIVGFDSSSMQNDGQSGSGPTVGVPVEALTINDVTPSDPDPKKFSTTVTTGEGGYASLKLLGGRCNNPRGYIEGQLYGLRYAAGDTLPDEDPGAPGNEKINMMLFDVFSGPVTPGKPSWIVDILPAFQVYANLYPAMHRIVRLDDYGSVVMRKNALLRAFESDLNAATYMPTTRDLSDPKRDMIITWLKDPALTFMNQTVLDVKAALQTILELEHATMPPYLTALYSIKPGYNQYIADTLREVAEQEMLHFALACNILTAIGGQPNINKIGFVPKFPGPLPGGLRSGLIIRLRKCSVEQMKTFVAIEAPEEQYLLEDGESSENNHFNTKQKNPYTIGWVYTAVDEALTALQASGDVQFPDDLGLDEDSDDPRVAHQVDGAFGDKLFKIMKREDASKAIQQIMTEGEGSPADNDPAEGDIDPETGLPILSHFFRFQEIVKGRRLIIGDTAGTYSYNGPRIEINEDGVYNMQDDPRIEDQPLGSQQRERMESFALKYQGLLNGLQIAFTKDPSYLRQCMTLMFQLTISAQTLMEMPALNEDGSEKQDGTTCGVSFQVPITESGP